MARPLRAGDLGLLLLLGAVWGTAFMFISLGLESFSPLLLAAFRFDISGLTLLLVATTLLPFASGMAGPFYLGAALVLDGVFLAHAVAIWRRYSDALARRTFGYSIFYLAMLFAALMVDHYLPLLSR